MDERDEWTENNALEKDAFLQKSVQVVEAKKVNQMLTTIYYQLIKFSKTESN